MEHSEASNIGLLSLEIRDGKKEHKKKNYSEKSRNIGLRIMSKEYQSRIKIKIKLNQTQWNGMKHIDWIKIKTKLTI